MAGNFTFTWNGDDIVAQARRATERAMIAVAEAAVGEQKAVVHKLTGTLSRSIHAAPMNYVGESDHEDAAAGLDLQEDFGGAAYELPTWDGDDAVIWEGSWIPYACVENNRHPYMEPGLDYAMSLAPGIFQQAFEEEGLTLNV